MLSICYTRIERGEGDSVPRYVARSSLCGRSVMSVLHSTQSVPAADHGPSAERPAGEPERNERDGRGRFLPGNGGGPGNPFNRRVAALRKLMLAELSDEGARRLTRKMLEQAEQGDMSAARVFLQFTMGRAGPSIDPDRVDVDEWRLAQESAVPIQGWYALLQLLPAELVNRLTSIIWPCMTELFGRFMKEGMAERRAPKEAAANGDGETDGEVGREVAEPTPGEPEPAPSTNGGNGKRHAAPVDARAKGTADQKQPSAPTGNDGKHGAPSQTAANGDRAAARRRAAKHHGDRPRQQAAMGSCGAVSDDGGQSFARVLAGLPPEVLEAFGRG
jgi:hypothetical protein